ncbi:MAG: hypothetical protein GH151_04920 [Bacteroidetes bacterium]|nr:hypothetical protein [Bacteroidota bacterium]
MNIKWINIKSLKFLTILFSAFFIASCGSGGDKQRESEITVDMTEIDQELFEDIDEAKKIFYSLPSPLETAMLIRSAGAQYDAELLNSVDNAQNYTTNKSMALNLGIYTCDLSFASLYDQTQASISYMGAAKKMADGLGILDAIDEKTIEDLEENINNRERIMDIVSETFLNSSAFLKENDRAALSAIVLVGGWMEGLYIATELVNRGTFEDNKLVIRIVDQKLSLEIVMKLLEENQSNPDVAGLIEEINELKAIFDQIKIETSVIEPIHDQETNVTTLKSKSQSNLTPELFIELSEKVRSLRNTFVL